MGPVTAASALLLLTAFLGVVALTSQPGSRAYRGTTWALTGSVMVVAGIMLAILLGVEVPLSALAVLAGCPLLVLVITTVQARRLARLSTARETSCGGGSNATTVTPTEILNFGQIQWSGRLPTPADRGLA